MPKRRGARGRGRGRGGKLNANKTLDESNSSTTDEISNKEDGNESQQGESSDALHVRNEEGLSEKFLEESGEDNKKVDELREVQDVHEKNMETGLSSEAVAKDDNSLTSDKGVNLTESHSLHSSDKADKIENSEGKVEEVGEIESSDEKKDVSKVENSKKNVEDVDEIENSEEKAEDVGKIENSEETAEDVGRSENSEEKAEDVGKIENCEEKAEDVSRTENSEEKAEDVSKIENSEEKAEDVCKIENSEEKAEDVSKIENSEEKTEDVGKIENSEEIEDDVSKIENSEEMEEDVGETGQEIENLDIVEDSKITDEDVEEVEEVFIDKEVDDDVQYIDEEIDEGEQDLLDVIELGDNENNDGHLKGEAGKTMKAVSRKSYLSNKEDVKPKLDEKEGVGDITFEEISEGSMDPMEQEEIIEAISDNEMITEVSSQDPEEEKTSREKERRSSFVEDETLADIFQVTENEDNQIVKDKDNDDISDASLCGDDEGNLSLEEISEDEFESSKRRKSDGCSQPPPLDDSSKTKDNDGGVENVSDTKIESPTRDSKENDVIKKRSHDDEDEASIAKRQKLGETLDTVEQNQNELGKDTSVTAAQVDEEKSQRDPPSPHGFGEAAKYCQKLSKAMRPVQNAFAQTQPLARKGKIVQCSINRIGSNVADGIKKDPAVINKDKVAGIFEKYRDQLPSSVESIFTEVASTHPPDKGMYCLSLGPVTVADFDNAQFRNLCLGGSAEKFNLSFNSKMQGLLHAQFSKHSDVSRLIHSLKGLDMGIRYMIMSVVYTKCQDDSPQHWQALLIFTYNQESSEMMTWDAKDGKVRSRLAVSGVPGDISKDFVQLVFPEALYISTGLGKDHGRALTLGFSSTKTSKEISSCYELLLFNGEKVEITSMDPVLSESQDAIESGFIEEDGTVIVQDVEETDDTSTNSQDKSVETTSHNDVIHVPDENSEDGRKEKEKEVTDELMETTSLLDTSSHKEVIHVPDENSEDGRKEKEKEVTDELMETTSLLDTSSHKDVIHVPDENSEDGRKEKEKEVTDELMETTSLLDTSSHKEVIHVPDENSEDGRKEKEKEVTDELMETTSLLDTSSHKDVIHVPDENSEDGRKEKEKEVETNKKSEEIAQEDCHSGERKDNESPENLDKSKDKNEAEQKENDVEKSENVKKNEKEENLGEEKTKDEIEKSDVDELSIRKSINENVVIENLDTSQTEMSAEDSTVSANQTDESRKDVEETRKDGEETRKDGEESRKDGEETRKDGEELRKDGEESEIKVTAEACSQNTSLEDVCNANDTDRTSEASKMEIVEETVNNDSDLNKDVTQVSELETPSDEKDKTAEIDDTHTESNLVNEVSLASKSESQSDVCCIDESVSENKSMESLTDESAKVKEKEEEQEGQKNTETKGKDKKPACSKDTSLEDVSDDEMINTEAKAVEFDDDVIILKEEPPSRVVDNIDLTEEDKEKLVLSAVKQADDTQEGNSCDDQKDKVKEEPSVKIDKLTMTDGDLEVILEVIDVEEEEVETETVLYSRMGDYRGKYYNSHYKKRIESTYRRDMKEQEMLATITTQTRQNIRPCPQRSRMKKPSSDFQPSSDFIYENVYGVSKNEVKVGSQRHNERLSSIHSGSSQDDKYTNTRLPVYSREPTAERREAHKRDYRRSRSPSPRRHTAMDRPSDSVSAFSVTNTANKQAYNYSNSLRSRPSYRDHGLANSPTRHQPSYFDSSRPTDVNDKSNRSRLTSKYEGSGGWRDDSQSKKPRTRRSKSRSLSPLSSMSVSSNELLSRTSPQKTPVIIRRVSHSPISVSSHSLSPVSKSPSPAPRPSKQSKYRTTPPKAYRNRYSPSSRDKPDRISSGRRRSRSTSPYKSWDRRRSRSPHYRRRPVSPRERGMDKKTSTVSAFRSAEPWRGNSDAQKPFDNKIKTTYDNKNSAYKKPTVTMGSTQQTKQNEGSSKNYSQTGVNYGSILNTAVNYSVPPSTSTSIPPQNYAATPANYLPSASQSPAMFYSNNSFPAGAYQYNPGVNAFPAYPNQFNSPMYPYMQASPIQPQLTSSNQYSPYPNAQAAMSNIPPSSSVPLMSSGSTMGAPPGAKRGDHPMSKPGSGARGQGDKKKHWSMGDGSSALMFQRILSTPKNKK